MLFRSVLRCGIVAAAGFLLALSLGATLLPSVQAAEPIAVPLTKEQGPVVPNPVCPGDQIKAKLCALAKDPKFVHEEAHPPSIKWTYTVTKVETSLDPGTEKIFQPDPAKDKFKAVVTNVFNRADKFGSEAAVTGVFVTPGFKRITVTVTLTFQGVDGKPYRGTVDFQLQAAVTQAVFAAKSTRGDRVVSAKDNDLPGGEMTVEVTITPPGAQVNLSIENAKGNKGSAVFKDSGKDTSKITSPNKQGEAVKVTVLGRQTSGSARNMKIVAKDGAGKACGEFDFTVFRVNLSLLPDGEEITPKAVADLTLQGKRQDVKVAALSELFTGKTKVGMFSGRGKDGKARFGGSELTVGIIDPTKMNPQDFIRSDQKGKTPGDGFFIKRMLSGRGYLDDCFAGISGVLGLSLNVDNGDDTKDFSTGKNNTDFEDLNADNDAGTDLFIYSFDAPALQLPIQMPLKSVFRTRLNFTDQASYVGTICSAPLQWRIDQSIKRVSFDPFGDFLKDYQRDTTFDKAGDNTIGPKHLPLTRDLGAGASPLPAFSITNLQVKDFGTRLTFKRDDPLQFDFVLTGENLPVGQPVTVVFRDISGVGPALQVDAANTKITDKTTITGKAQFANRNTPGVYSAIVTIGGQCVNFQGGLIRLIGPIDRWVFLGLARQGNRILGRITAFDAIASQVIPAPPAPAVTNIGGTVTFKVGNVMDVGNNIYGFELMITAVPNQGAKTMKVKADGSGKTAEHTYELP
jgi:hypothetical protein